MKRASNILLLNLAIADFLMLAKTPIYIYNCLKFGPASGDLGNCKRIHSVHIHISIFKRFYFDYTFKFMFSLSCVWVYWWFDWNSINNDTISYII